VRASVTDAAGRHCRSPSVGHASLQLVIFVNLDSWQ